MLGDEKTVSRRERFARLNHDCTAMSIWINEEENTMKLEELKALSTKELTDLYNQYADKRVKRMESRAKLEERTAQKLREAGKLDEDMTAREARNIRETAKAGVNTDSAKDLAKTKAPTEAKGKGKSAKATSKASPATGKAQPPKGKGEGAGKAPKASRGAPVKNPTYVAIPEGSKGYNPKGFRTNPSSSRFQVLEYIRKAPTGRTREQCEKQFEGMDVNVTSSLYFLSKHGFAKVKED